MEFSQRYSKTMRPHRKPEIPGKIRIVETAGYRTTKVQIEEYLDAGRRLTEYRALKYDFEPGVKVDEDFEDITRRPGYDPADASRDIREAEENLKQSIEDKKDEKKRKEYIAKQKAEKEKVTEIPIETEKT